jgi:hypothetical protein
MQSNGERGREGTARTRSQTMRHVFLSHAPSLGFTHARHQHAEHLHTGMHRFFSFFRRLRDACACAPHVRPTSSSLLSPLPSHAASSAVPPFSVAADAGVWCRYGAIRWWRRAAFCTSSLRRCFRRSRPRTGTPSRLQIH